MDPDRHRGRPGIFLASSRDSLLDRQCGMGGQARCVLSRVETESGQDAPGADPFQVPAEAHDFLDQNLERAVCLEQRVGPGRSGERGAQQRDAAPFPAQRRRRRSGRSRSRGRRRERRGPRSRGTGRLRRYLLTEPILLDPGAERVA